jgi:DNA-directed RNA polymerase subunit M/transcription elongation factor TFIIS
MPIEFCKKCHGILKIRTWENQEYLICRKCKTKKKTKNSSVLTTEKFKKEKLGIGIAKNNTKVGYDFKCPKCGNKKCRVIDLGIMYGDEDWIYLLQCTKCDYGERIGEMS